MSGVDPHKRAQGLSDTDASRRIAPVITDVEGVPYMSPRPLAELIAQNAEPPDKKIDTLNKILAAVGEISFKKEEYPGSGDIIYRASFIFDNPPLSDSDIDWNFNNHPGRSDFKTVGDALGDLFLRERKIIANTMIEPQHIHDPEIGYKAQRISFMIPATQIGSIAEADALVRSLLEAKEKLGEKPE